VNCHGGDGGALDPERSMDAAKGFVGKPAPLALSTFCGKCHSDAELMRTYNPSLRVDQTREYATSVHGKLLAEGNVEVATCVSCHGSHGIRAVSDSNAPVFPAKVAETCGACHTDQSAQYHASVHADALLTRQDLSAPTCNDCHGNHGAAPPGVTAVANVCGACHSRQSDLFRQSPHDPAFEALGVGQCLACHNNHDVSRPDDDMLGIGPNATCVQCHSEGEPGFEAAKLMKQDIDELSAHFNAA
jgi:predicted CXXCH cytochrome family protein